MALPVLDGNQSATTLSSVVTGGEHIVAHSVVSLGATAISNINSAVSGVVVTIPGLAHLGNSVATDGVADVTTNFIKIGGHQSGSNQTAHIVHVSAGGSMSVDASGSSVTFSQAPVTFGAITGSASILNFPSTQTIAGTVTANGGNFVFSESEDTSSAKGVLIGFEDDASTEYRKVTDAQPLPISISAINNTGGFSGSLPVSGTVTVGNSVTIGSLPAISGTVTANLSAQFQDVETSLYAVRSAIAYDDDGDLKEVSNSYPLPVVVNAGSVTIGSLPAISGTVTANSIFPRVTLIDGSGTVATANTAITVFASSSTRSYLLVQVTTGSAFVNVGATATTVNGINLTAGQGYSWETTIPQGIVSLISTTTNSRYVAKEA